MNKGMLIIAIELEKQATWPREGWNFKRDEFHDFIEKMYGKGLVGNKQKLVLDKLNLKHEFTCPVCNKVTNAYESYEDCQHCTSPLEHLHLFTGGRMTRVRLEELERRLAEQGVPA
tara:strand:- start:1079 stop:1426 length:348 start_codon:yes stop_codon:yes gene_type:complete